jgi:hypothetical protein
MSGKNTINPHTTRKNHMGAAGVPRSGWGTPEQVRALLFVIPAKVGIQGF